MIAGSDDVEVVPEKLVLFDVEDGPDTASATEDLLAGATVVE